MELGNPAHGAWPFSLQIFRARGRGHLSHSPCHPESSEPFHSCACGKSTSSQSEISHLPSWGLAKQFLSLGGHHRPQSPWLTASCETLLSSHCNSTRRAFLPTSCLSEALPAFCCPLDKSKCLTQAPEWSPYTAHILRTVTLTNTHVKRDWILIQEVLTS